MRGGRFLLILALSAALAGSVGGCATFSNRSKTLLLMGGAGAIAASFGAAIAPEGENRGAHAFLWGGGAAALAGAIGLFAFDEEAKSKEAAARAERLQKDLAACTQESAPEILATNQVGMEKPLPSKFRNLITPGQWSLYKVDRWVSSTESELVHQDLVFRFSQPQLNPSAKTGGPELGVGAAGAGPPEVPHE